MATKSLGAAARAALLAMGALAGCTSPGSLVQLDVSGDQTFSNVTLRLEANRTVVKAFADVSIPAAPETLALGMYLPSSIEGDVELRATVDDGTCVLGGGRTLAPGVAAGQATVPVALEIVHIADCSSPLPDGGVSGSGGAAEPGTGGADGSGGSGGAVFGSGGRPGSGGSVAGTGGRAGSGGQGTGGAGTGGAIGSGGAPAGPCGLLIDDMEANTGRICEGDGRAGHWFTYVDAFITSTITPQPTQSTMAPPYPVSPPRGSSRYATRAFGRFSSYAGIGCLLNNPVPGETPKTYDATAHSGIRFYAMGAGGLTVNINTSATVSTIYGGTCGLASCLGATYRFLGLSPVAWTQFTLPFSSLLSGTAVFRAADIWSIEFQPSVLGAFDLWIDDLTFY